MKLKNKLSIFLIILMLVFSISFSVSAALDVHFIDVGQGDAILIQSSETNVLIDAGDRYQSIADKMVAYLSSNDVEKLDAVFSTHPHADHIGGMSAIINNFEVSEIYDSGKIHTSRTYEDYLMLIDEKDIPFSTPRRGDKIEVNELTFEVLHPGEDIESYSLNNASIVLHLVYEDISFLFTGDLEGSGEDEVVNAGFDIESTVLKVSHHGSRTSTQEHFLQEVSPEVAIIQVGEDNRYDHPSPEVISLLQGEDVDIYRSDYHGDIVINTDGKDYSIYTQKDLEQPEIEHQTEDAAELININTASQTALEELHGIGPATARNIIEYRDNNNGFQTKVEIKNVRGIGPATFDDIKGDITI